MLEKVRDNIYSLTDNVELAPSSADCKRDPEALELDGACIDWSIFCARKSPVPHKIPDVTTCVLTGQKDNFC